ncbi:MAG: hypothetical protein ACI4KM_01375 [Oscillospiraceae bacterium]
MNSIKLEDYSKDLPNVLVFHATAEVGERRCAKWFRSWVKQAVSKGESLDGYLLSVNEYIMRPLALAVLLDDIKLTDTVQSNSERGLLPITIAERIGCKTLKITANGITEENANLSALMPDVKTMDAVIFCNKTELISRVIPNADMLPFSYMNMLITSGKHELISSLSDRIKRMYDFPSLLKTFKIQDIERLFTADELAEKIADTRCTDSWSNVLTDESLAGLVSESFDSYLNLFNTDEGKADFAEKALLMIAAHGFTIPESQYYKDTVDISPLEPSYRLVAAEYLKENGIKPVIDIAKIRSDSFKITYLSANAIFTLINTAEIISDGGFDDFERTVITSLSAARLKKATKLGIFNSSNIKEALRYTCSQKAVEKTKVLLEYSQTLK